jgi:large subunit ribosomal protein L6
MSRIGGSPITVPDGVSVAIENTQLTAKGSKGELVVELSNDVDVAVAENVVTITPKGKDKQSRAIWGTVRSNINNAVIGVSTGFTRKLEINGVGYRAAMQGNKLSLNLGYSHPVTMDVPAGLTVSVDNNTKIDISGADKQLLGQFAAEVRAKRPPEPFKGKGVKYADEYIVRKEGKKK